MTTQLVRTAIIFREIPSDEIHYFVIPGDWSEYDGCIDPGEGAVMTSRIKNMLNLIYRHEDDEYDGEYLWPDDREKFREALKLKDTILIECGAWV